MCKIIHTAFMALHIFKMALISVCSLMIHSYCLTGELKMSYITELKVSLKVEQHSDLRAQGYISVPGNLNQGTSGNKIHLWYKRGGGKKITRIQLSFDNEMTNGLKSAGYNKLEENLNAGAGGDTIYLWHYSGSSENDIPIVDLHVTTEVEAEAEMFGLGWERVACDLNRNTRGKGIYLWVMREKPTYICEIKATAKFNGDENNFNNSWIRVDENTNRGAEGVPVFIWYRQSHESSSAITSMNISINDQEYSELDSNGYERVKQDLNQGSQGNKIFLWFKKGDPTPIRAISVLANSTAKQPYEQDKVTVIDKNLNTGNNGNNMYLCYYK